MNIISVMFNFFCNRRWLCRLIALFCLAVITYIGVINNIKEYQLVLLIWSAFTMMSMGAIIATSIINEEIDKS